MSEINLDRKAPASLRWTGAQLDLDSAGALAGLLEAKRKAIETVEIEARLAALEAKHVKS